MKYGRLDKGLLDFSNSKAILEDKLNKGLIDGATFKRELEKFNKLQLQYITATNGAYNPPSQNKGRKATKLADKRRLAAIQRMRDAMEAAKKEQAEIKVAELSNKEELPSESE